MRIECTVRFKDLDPESLPDIGLIPYVVRPIVEAARLAHETIPVVRSVVESLGFHSFVYALSMTPRPDREAQLFIYTTLPHEWLALYDQRGYAEIDPRWKSVVTNSGVQIWDQ